MWPAASPAAAGKELPAGASLAGEGPAPRSAISHGPSQQKPPRPGDGGRGLWERLHLPSLWEAVSHPRWLGD